MEKHEAIEWAIASLQDKLDELQGGYGYDQTLEAIKTLEEIKKDL